MAGQDLRGLGWDIDTAHSRPRGTLFPVGSFGHAGFTGVTLWMDPRSDTYVAVLANVIHQRGRPPIVNLSGDVATATARLGSVPQVVGVARCGQAQQNPDMNDFAPNSAVSGAAVPLEMNPVLDTPSAGGEPRTGATALGMFAGLEVGVWEMTEGIMQDTEVDELFVVISGSARIDFVDGGSPLELTAGDVVRLRAGTRTVWTVRTPLRKVYLAAP